MTPRLSASIATLAFLLAACGSGDERASAGADSTAAAPPPAVAAAEADTGTAACPPEPGDTVMRVRADGPEYRFRLVRSEGDEEGAGAVDSIVVWRGCERVQVLAPGEDEVPAEMEIDRLSLVDLDFDGHRDLGFVTLMGMANSTSEYWRFDPASGRFVPLGAFDTFEVDSARRELKTYVRGGHAGLLFTTARYRVQGGRPVKVREESQDLMDDVAGYVRIVRELRGGALTETSRDTMTEDEAIARMEAGP